MALCNQEWKKRYALLNNASETEGRLYLRQGWMSSRFQQAETARNGASGSGDPQDGRAVSLSETGEALLGAPQGNFQWEKVPQDFL
jgi:hypothetical protein